MPSSSLAILRVFSFSSCISLFAVSAEKTADSQKVKKEQIVPAEKPKGSRKVEPEVFSRYYRSPEAESPKAEKPKSKKPNPFCEECGSKIAAKDMFCTSCGAKR